MNTHSLRPDPSPLCFTPQGKEIIEFYLNELEDEGITHVPRWTPSSVSLPLPRPTSLSTSPPVLPNLATAPAVSVPQPTDAKDSTSQDTKQDGGALQADSLAEILAGTPEGLFTRTETALSAEYSWPVNAGPHILAGCVTGG